MALDLFRFSWFAAVYFPAALLIAGTGIYIGLRERGNRISREFFGFTSFLAAWMMLAGARMALVDADAAALAVRFSRAAVALGIPHLLQFSFTALQAWDRNRLLMRVNCVVGLLIALLSVGTPWVVAGVAPMPVGFKPQPGPLGVVFTLWVGGMAAWLALEAVRAWQRSRPSGFQRRQIRVFCAALAILMIGVTSLLSYEEGVLHAIGTSTVVAFGLLAGYLAARHGIANVTARFATPEFADVMRAGMAILDHDGAIQFVNEPAARMLGVARYELIGRALPALLGKTPQSIAAMALAPTDGGTEVAYALPGRGERRFLSLSVSAMKHPRGEPTAFVCLMRDTTDEHRRRASAARREPTLEERELRKAVAERQFVVHYQPVVELKRGTIAGFEALVRWQHPRLGLRSPQDFLPEAEALGLGGAIDRLVLEQACADLPRLRAEAGGRNLFMSVNQSSTALSRPNLVGEVGDIVARCGLTPKDLRLELLESTIVNDSIRETLRGLRQAGFGICIDDFGTGHSALSRLHDAPVTTLKIDRLFVDEMLGGAGRKIIGSIVALAYTLDLGVIAEGVTAPEQVSLLREMGCGYAQGYLYSPPCNVAGAIELLRRRHPAGQPSALPAAVPAPAPAPG